MILWYYTTNPGTCVCWICFPSQTSLSPTSSQLNPIIIIIKWISKRGVTLTLTTWPSKRMSTSSLRQLQRSTDSHVGSWPFTLEAGHFNHTITEQYFDRRTLTVGHDPENNDGTFQVNGGRDRRTATTPPTFRIHAANAPPIRQKPGYADVADRWAERGRLPEYTFGSL